MSNEKNTGHAPKANDARQSEDPFARSDAAHKAKKAEAADHEAQQNEGGGADAQARDAEAHGFQASKAGSPDERIRDLEERLKRAIAEQENVRKRMEREKEDIARYATANFAREVLGIADNIQRAIMAVPRDAAENDSALKTFLDGIEVTERELHKAMERHGIAKLDPLGEKFDPNFHQAMFEVPTPDQPSGVVMQVVQPGYTLGDRVLRPAMVGVSKAAPAASGANENEPQADSTEEPSGAASNPGEQAPDDQDASQEASPQASAPQTHAEPDDPEPGSGQPRGSSRLNEPVINAETQKTFRTGETAGRKG